MRVLFAKDLRLYRMPMMAMFLLGLGVYLLGSILLLREDKVPTEAWWIMFSRSYIYAIGISTLIAAALGGMSIAGERSDRTALFTAMLPVRRGKIVASKLLTSSAILIATWLAHLVIGLVAIVLHGKSMQAIGIMNVDVLILQRSRELMEPLLVITTIGIAMYCIAWLVGSFSTSSVISACIGMAVTLAMTLVIGLWFEENQDWTRRHHGFLALILAAIHLLLAIPSLLIGTVIVLRRTEP
jgi:ABC-type transport system involved in multi-copper enzyme maturation permease subunit